MKTWLLVLGLLLGGATASAQTYPWPTAPTDAEPLHARFSPPEGFSRVKAAAGSFAHWLRHLPLLPPNSPVKAFNGRVLDERPLGVIAIDVGERDLQQCADSVIRLRAEYLRSVGRADEVGFHFVSGDLARWRDYRAGKRPVFGKGRQKTRWPKKAAARDDDRAWRYYLNLVFGYASTLSLQAYETQPKVSRASAIVPGDFFVIGGSPGHAVIVLDVAHNDEGETRLLIGQGFMPAQSMHIVPNARGGAWHTLDAEGRLHIHSWPRPFPLSSLRSFSLKER